jgi:hypothetical protein
MVLCRLDDRTLVATETSGEKAVSWLSGDGRTWTSAGPRDVCAWTTLNLYHVGGRNVLFAAVDPLDLRLIGDDLSEIKLAQSGDLPDPTVTASFVFGPTGILASDGNGTLYVGVPIVG